MKQRSILVIFILISTLVGAQDTQIIRLNNASFEGEHKDATCPVGWVICTERSTPDILPGVWGVYTPPSDGDTYVGLITREDGSFESIGQRLSSPANVGQCYQFTIDVAHSPTYSGYSQPLKLKIWGGSTFASRSQQIFVTNEITKPIWKTYTIKFVPIKTINYLRLDAFHKDHFRDYKGNILIDNISPIKPCPKA